MKKIACILLFLFIGAVGCMPTEHYLITGIHLIPLESFVYDASGDPVTAYRSTDEFTDKAIFEVRGESELVADNAAPKTVSRCLAFQPGRVGDNRLLEETLTMIFDKPFVYGEDIVEAGTDLFRHPEIAKEINTTMDDHPDFEMRNPMLCKIEFSGTFTENSSFDDDYYTVTLSCSTSDKKFLQADATVKFAWD